MKELKEHFPPGIDYAIVYDTTPFINESISEVFETLFDAIVLVAVVVLVFLQNWRSALIPLIAVPVAVVGTFAVMAAMGFSLNNLTLFGLVLAIGIVVDDAIVVVEAVEHHIEHGLTPREATLRAMEQVSGPVVAIGLVLAAVFVPCAFITGITGQFFRQFALTIAVSTVISAFNSLTLSPALSALLLRPREQGALRGAAVVRLPADRGLAGPQDRPALGRAGAGRPASARVAGDCWTPCALWGPIVAGALAATVVGRAPGPAAQLPARLVVPRCSTEASTSRPAPTRGRCRACCASACVVLVVYGGLLALTWWGFTHTPTGFIPQQDKGYLLVNVQLPDAASVARTEDVVAANRGDRPEDAGRQAHGGHRRAVDPAQRQRLQLRGPVPDARRLRAPHRARACPATPSPPRCRSGFRRRCPRRSSTSSGRRRWRAWARRAASRSSSRTPATTACRPCRRPPTRSSPPARPTRTCKGCSPASAPTRPGWSWSSTAPRPRTAACRSTTCARRWSPRSGRTTSTTSTASAAPGRSTCRPSDTFRQSVEDVKQLKVRNNQGEMVPLADFATVRYVSGPVMVMRYNMYPSAADPRRRRAGHQLRPGHRRTWKTAANERPAARRCGPSGPSWPCLQLQTGNTAMWVFLLAVVLVFLVLAAQYESWSLPLAVILVVPMCLLCSHRRRGHGEDGRQHLHADRLPGAGRPGVQERHPDRRVRQGAARGRACRAARRRWRPASCGCGRSS